MSSVRPSRLLQLVDVSYHYTSKGVDTIHSITLQIRSDEFVAILGPNGAGKTTLARLMIGILRPTQGTVLLDGQDLSGCTVAQISHWIGFLFQNPNHQLFEDNAWDEVMSGMKNMPLSEVEKRQRAEEALASCGLSALKEQPPENLSIGEKKRLAVASVLAMSTDFLILDEPTTGQTWSHLQPLMNLIERLNQQNKGILMITHDVDLAARYASRVVVLAAGRILFDGAKEELFRNSSLLQEAHLEPPTLLTLSLKLAHWGIQPCFRSEELVEQLVRRKQCRE